MRFHGLGMWVAALVLCGSAAAARRGKRKKDDKPYPLDTFGTHLTPDTVQEATMGYGAQAVVIFHAPWCSSCKKFATKWMEVAASLEKSHPSLTVASFDMDAHKEYGKKTFDVKTYPTFIVFTGGKQASVSLGDELKTTKQVVAWIASKVALDPYTILSDSEALKEFTAAADNNGVVVGTYEKGAIPSWFAEAAWESPGTPYGVIAPTVSPHSSGTTVLYTTFTEPYIFEKSEEDTTKFGEAVALHVVPGIVEFDREDFRQREAKIQLLVFTDISIEEAHALLGPAVEFTRGFVKIVLIRSTDKGIAKLFDVQHLGSAESDAVVDAGDPEWTVVEGPTGKRGSFNAKSNIAWVWDRTNARSSSKIPYPGRTFHHVGRWVIDEILNLEVQPVQALKSQEPVDLEVNAASGVQVVTGIDFEDFVKRADEANAIILFEFYADWYVLVKSGHVVRLAAPAPSARALTPPPPPPPPSLHLFLPLSHPASRPASLRTAQVQTLQEARAAVREPRRALQRHS